jgi:cytochrome P450
MVELSTKFVQRWGTLADSGVAVDVTRDTTRLTLETIAVTGFGYSFSVLENEQEHPFVSAMMRTLRFARREAMHLPFTMGWFGRHAIAQQALDQQYLAREVDDVIARRLAEKDTSTDDLLGLMLNSVDPASGERLDDTNIRYQILTFLVAGHETTSGALSFALYFLAKNPEVFAKARMEVDAVWGSDPEVTPTYEQVAKLRYVRRVFDEALRLWPTAPGFARKSRVDQYLGGHPIKKNEWVIAVLPLIHRDPDVWENPEVFDPDRFLPENVRTRPAHAYKPWGIGDRACIGRQFAVHEALLVLGRIIQRFDLHDSFDYQLQLNEALTIKPIDFNLTLTRRV